MSRHVTIHPFFSSLQQTSEVDSYILPILQRKIKEARKVFKGKQLVNGRAENPTQDPLTPKPGPHPAVGSCGLPALVPLCLLSYLWKPCALNADSRGKSGIMRDSEGTVQSWAWAPVEFGGAPRGDQRSLCV